MMLSKAAILLSMAAGYAAAIECTITTTSVIYGFATPSATVVPSVCERLVNGLCVVENAAPEGQAIAARAEQVIDSIDGVSNIDVCISTYCIPNEECESVGFDDSGTETICYIYGTPIDFSELVIAIGFSVAFVEGGGELHSSTTTHHSTSTTSAEEESSTETSATTTEESSSTEESSTTTEEASSTSTPEITSSTTEEESSTTDLGITSTSSEESSSTTDSSTESSSTTA